MEDMNYSDSSASKKRLSKRLLFFGLFFVVVLVLLGGLFYFLSQGNKDEAPKTISLNEAPTITEEEPTASPTPEVDRSEIKLAVQNGSGVAGAAGDVADALKALGYQIVSTGNANNFEYEDLTIQAKTGKEDVLSLLESDLSKDHTVGDTSATLSANLTYDALVIVGK